jgi:hypothetical protein
MNALQRLVVRLNNAVFGKPPHLPPLDPRVVKKMSISEIQAFHQEIKTYLDQVEAAERRKLQIEAAIMQRQRRKSG